MNLGNDKIIGIVGGMGPQAGCSLFDTIIRHTKAVNDQQHLSVILMSFPQHLTDRTAFLNGDSNINPAINIVSIIKRLELAGAKIIGIACNTSHSPAIFNVILEELSKTNSHVKLLSMPIETCNYIREKYGHVRRVGIMSTNGTYKSGLYQDLLEELGYDVVVPDFEFQDKVIHRMIYDPEFGVKSSPAKITRKARSLMDKALHYFKSERTDAIILGCTELPLILTRNDVMDMLIIDPAEMLAKALIRESNKSEFAVNPRGQIGIKAPINLRLN